MAASGSAPDRLGYASLTRLPDLKPQVVEAIKNWINTRLAQFLSISNHSRRELGTLMREHELQFIQELKKILTPTELRDQLPRIYCEALRLHQARRGELVLEWRTRSALQREAVEQHAEQIYSNELRRVGRSKFSSSTTEHDASHGKSQAQAVIRNLISGLVGVSPRFFSENLLTPSQLGPISNILLITGNFRPKSSNSTVWAIIHALSLELWVHF